MNKTVRVVLLVACLTIFSPPLFAENVTLSTYYPAPFGSYDRMKLVPRDSLELDPHCNDVKDTGIMYYDNGLKKKAAGIYVCQKTFSGAFNWGLVSAFLPEDEKDKASTEKPVISNQKVVCIDEDGKLGVCLNNSSADGTCACQQGAPKKSKK
jgi:hypothetical protein